MGGGCSRELGFRVNQLTMNEDDNIAIMDPLDSPYDMTHISMNLSSMLLKVDMPFDESLVEGLCKSIDKYGDEMFEKTNLKSPMTSYTSQLDHYNEFHEAYEIIASFIRNSGITKRIQSMIPNSPFVINDFWGASYQDKEYARIHQHGPLAVLSFVYFLKTEDNPSPLLFHPNVLLTTEEVANTADQGEVMPTEGQLLLFPSNLYHSVRPFDPPIKEKRYVLAGNVTALLNSPNRYTLSKGLVQLYSNVYPLLEDWVNTELQNHFYGEPPDQQFMNRMYEEQQQKKQNESPKKMSIKEMINTN